MAVNVSDLLNVSLGGGTGNVALQNTPWDVTTNAPPVGAQPGYMYKVVGVGTYNNVHFVPDDLAFIMPDNSIVNLTNKPYSVTNGGGYASISPTDNITAYIANSDWVLTNSNRTIETKTGVPVTYGWPETFINNDKTNIEIVVEKFYSGVTPVDGDQFNFVAAFISAHTADTMLGLLISNQFSMGTLEFQVAYSGGVPVMAVSLTIQNLGGGSTQKNFTVPPGVVLQANSRINIFFDRVTLEIQVMVDGTLLSTTDNSQALAPVLPNGFDGWKVAFYAGGNGAHATDTARYAINFGQIPFTNTLTGYVGYLLPSSHEFQGPIRIISNTWDASGGQWPTLTPLTGDAYFASVAGVVEGVTIPKYTGVYWDGNGWAFVSPNVISGNMIWMGDWGSLSTYYQLSVLPNYVEGHVYKITQSGVVNKGTFLTVGGTTNDRVLEQFRAGTIIVARNNTWERLVEPSTDLHMTAAVDDARYPKAKAYGSYKNNNYVLANVNDATDFGLNQGGAALTEVEITVQDADTYNVAIGFFASRSGITTPANVSGFPFDAANAYNTDDYCIYIKRQTGELFICGKTEFGVEVGPTVIAVNTAGALVKGDRINVLYVFGENSFYFAINGTPWVKFSPLTYGLSVGTSGTNGTNFKAYGYFLVTGALYNQSYFTAPYMYEFNFRGVSAALQNTYKVYSGSYGSLQVPFDATAYVSPFSDDLIHTADSASLPSLIIGSSCRSYEDNLYSSFVDCTLKERLAAASFPGGHTGYAFIAPGSNSVQKRFSYSSLLCLTNGEVDSVIGNNFVLKLRIPVLPYSDLNAVSSYFALEFFSSGHSQFTPSSAIGIAFVQQGMDGNTVTPGTISVYSNYSDSFQSPAPVDGYYELYVGLEFPTGNNGGTFTFRVMDVNGTTLYTRTTALSTTISGLLELVANVITGGYASEAYGVITDVGLVTDKNYASFNQLARNQSAKFDSERLVLRAYQGSGSLENIFKVVGPSYNSDYGVVHSDSAVMIKGEKIIPLGKSDALPVVAYGYTGWSGNGMEMVMIDEAYLDRNVILDNIFDITPQSTSPRNIIHIKCPDANAALYGSRFRKVRLTFPNPLSDIDLTIVRWPLTNYPVSLRQGQPRVIDIEFFNNGGFGMTIIDEAAKAVSFELSTPRTEVITPNTSDLDHFYAPCNMILSTFSAQLYTVSTDGNIYWNVTNETNPNGNVTNVIYQGYTTNTITESSLLVYKGDKVQLNTSNLGANTTATGLKVVMFGKIF